MVEAVPSGSSVVPLAPVARTVDAGRSVEWFKAGWNLFLKNPGIWIAISVIMLVTLFVLSMIPLLGQLAVLLAMPVAGGGLVLGCKSLSEGGELRIDHLLAGFQSHGASLAVVGVLYAAGGLLAFGAALLIGSGGALGGAIAQGWSGASLAAGSMALGLLVWFALSVLLGMAFWFAPALVVLRGLAPFDAMKASLGACLQNFIVFLVFGILATVAGFIAMLPMGLGLIVLAPVMIGAAYASYLDVYA
ncbi:MAG: hypothetical protein IPL03_18045 [Sterolibacteriaceae bacterium]|nr:hypothetical protein [Candidatus Methylophosphatis haderslevensis]